MKLKEFQNELSKNKIDYAIIFNHPNKPDPNFKYLAGLDSIFSCLVVSKKGSPKLFASIIEVGIAKHESKIKDVITINKDLYAMIKKSFAGKNIGINYNHITINMFNRLKKEFKAKFHDISKIFDRLRITKTKEETNYLRKSCSYISRIMQTTISNINKFKTELQVKDFIESQVKKLNLELSFPIIVASGKNSKDPHHFPTHEKLKGFTIIDIGVKYKGYCSDMTRTVYIGKPSKEEIHKYNLVLESQLESIKNLRKLSPAELHKQAQKKLGKYFVHALGHGVGIEIHESPSISTKSKDKFKEAMVITIEPGYYDKFGIRIEDDILITKKGHEILTKFNKELIVIWFLNH